ncbi:c-type cytochrome [Croceicoccus mobilis]|uniref:Cytochrome c n=1 Tax=Croceicoccus mobilis TaxID=1703339 RepID=A0A916YXE7_9SPHN|nr:cytochrome c [Croceicoccus mobilis]GGD65514.1 hypothetical protein GCM10010990_13770 [Croceicoccus mobilis]
MKNKLLIGAFGLTAMGATVTTAAAGDLKELPEAPGKDVTMAVCTQCHGIDLFAQPRTPDEWSQVVTFMIGNGMSVSDDEYRIILDYLSTNLAPKPPDSASAE